MPVIIDVTFDPMIARVGPIQLSWASVFTTVGLVVAFWLGWRAATAYGVPSDQLGNIIFWIAIGGLIGGRLFQVLDHLPYYLAIPRDILAVDDGGISLLGYWVGGVIGVFGAARWTGIPAWGTLDALTPAALVGQLIGWLGCLCTGATWGLPTGGAWGIVYWNPHDLLPPQMLGVPTQPYPLYQVAGLLLILASLRLGQRWLSVREGQVFLATMLTYSGLQFILASLRPESVSFHGLGATQMVALSSMALLLMVTWYWFCSPWRGSVRSPEVTDGG